MKPINGYLIRTPTDEEIELVARLTYESVYEHRARLRSHWPHSKLTQCHKDDMPPWDRCPEPQRETARGAIRDLIRDAGGFWPGCIIPVAHITCGCTPVAMVMMRVALVELGIFPLRLPDIVHGPGVPTGHES